MLTKNDLKAIQDIVKEVVDVAVRPINSRLDSIEKEIKPIRSMQRNIRKIRKGVDKVIDYFDYKEVKLQKRVKRIEDHLGFPQN